MSVECIGIVQNIGQDNLDGVTVYGSSYIGDLKIEESIDYVGNLNIGEKAQFSLIFIDIENVENLLFEVSDVEGFKK